MKKAKSCEFDIIFGVLLLTFVMGMFLDSTQAEECSTCSARPSPPPEPRHLSLASALGYCPSYGGSRLYEYIQSVFYTQKSGHTLVITVFIFIANPTGCVSGKPCPEYDDSPEYINAWIDWDGDKLFESDERVLDAALTGYLGINYYGTMSTSNIVTIPTNAVSHTWMRVNLGWAHDPNDPCEDSWKWGDVVDKEVQITPLKLKIVRLDALDDFSIKDVNDPIWVENDPFQYDPIADGKENGFLSWTFPGSFKIRATIDASPSKPSWKPKCKYSWLILGTDKSGVGEFTGWSGEFNIQMPQKVGRYTLNLAFSLYDDNGNKVNTQLMSHTLYAAYKNSKKPNPKEIWLQKATDWASGAMDEEEVASKINRGIYDTGWLYGYPPYRCKISQFGGWPELIENPSVFASDCVGFSDVWKALVKVLGIDAGTIRVYGKHKKGFVTKTNLSAPDGQRGNAHPPSQALDRWVFAMHQIGKLGAWIGGGYYDPTFGSKYGNKDEFIDWHVIKVESGGWVLKADSHTLYLKDSIGNYGWRDWEYHSPHNLLVENQDGAVFTGNYTTDGIDSDGDGIYNYLTVEAEVNITKPGNYFIVGVLKSNDTVITFRNNKNSTVHLSYVLSSSDLGFKTVTLSFSGEDIYNAGIDGIYIADLTILDESGSIIDNKSFETSLYNNEQFGELPARIKALTDYAEDSDGDGLFDYLVVGVNIDVNKAMNYSIEGILCSSEGDHLLYQTNKTYLGGPGEVKLYFEGAKIYKSQKDGPYILALTVSEEGDNEIGYVEYNTSTYSYIDFQEPDGRFRGVYSDHGVDTDNDGLFNYLAVEIGVDVKIPKDYTIEGWLYDSRGNAVEIVTSSTYLDAGSQSAILYFNGLSINQSQIDGPYHLKYITLSGSGYIDFIKDAHTTFDYKFTDFQEPPIPLVRLTGRYSDYGTDTDNDGIFDYLTVDVEVVLANPGYCVIKGRLMDTNEQEIVWAENTAKLEANQPQVIQLNFDGEAIYTHRVNGPYYLRDVYIYHTGDPQQPDYVHDAYTTASYSYTKFGPAIIMEQGWNLISIPVEPTDTAIDKVLEPISGHYQSVWAYDSGWKKYIVGAPSGFNDLDALETGKGYWINMMDDATLTFTGDPITDPTVMLKAGWNLVGYKGKVSKPTQTALSSIADKLISAWGYDKGWKRYIPGASGNNLDMMEPGLGYWINVTADCIWDVNAVSPAPQKNLSVQGSSLTETDKPQIPYILYGEVLVDGVKVKAGSPPVPEVVLKLDGKVLSSYRLGAVKKYDDFYVLEVPVMDGSNEMEIYVQFSDGVTAQAVATMPPGKSGQLIRFDLSVRRVPEVSQLWQNYPNPFNPDTWIPYQLKEDADVEIRIYSSTGQLVRKLDLGHKPAGFYTTKERSAYWDGKNEAGEHVASGVYFYTIQAGNFTAVKKMVILR